MYILWYNNNSAKVKQCGLAGRNCKGDPPRLAAVAAKKIPRITIPSDPDGGERWCANSRAGDPHGMEGQSSSRWVERAPQLWRPLARQAHIGIANLPTYFGRLARVPQVTMVACCLVPLWCFYEGTFVIP